MFLFFSSCFGLSGALKLILASMIHAQCERNTVILPTKVHFYKCVFFVKDFPVAFSRIRACSELVRIRAESQRFVYGGASEIN